MSFTRFLVQDESFPVHEKLSVKNNAKCYKKRGGTNSNVIIQGMGPIRKIEWADEKIKGHHRRRLSQPYMDTLDFASLKSSWSTHHLPTEGKSKPDMESNHRTWRTPTRHLPQNQAIITTDHQGIILLFNHIAAQCFSLSKPCVGESFIKTCLQEPFRSQITDILERRVEKTDGNNQKVIICGATIPILKKDKSSSVGFLWLKEKLRERGEKVYIWIIEEIYETTLSIYVDSDCNIQRVLGTAIQMYGYKESEMRGHPIQRFVPALSREPPADHLEKMDRLKFFGVLSQQGIYFPVILSRHRHVSLQKDDFATFVIQITSLPSISGAVTFHRHSGLIHHLNTVPAKYLFGYPVEAVTNKLTIGSLIPQIPTILSNLGNRDTADSQLCRALASPLEEALYVCHRDQSKFFVDFEIQCLEQDDLIQTWITYDRASAVLEHERDKHRISSAPIHTQPSPVVEPKRPKMPLPRPCRISSFGTVDEAKRLFPSNVPDDTQHNASLYTPSRLNERHPLDDYVVLHALGQGTYGMAKLAYRKDDPFQKKLVIKYILKSKIIVDSWIRDRQLGSIPMEIHILNTLRKHPHLNCCRLVTSMEDEDCYFVVMELLGSGMDLFDYIELNKKMAEREIRHLFHQIAKAVQHLHTHRIVHRDIKDENVILDQEGTIHLIDFGCAAYYRRGRKFDTFNGTLEYCAPEVLKGNLYEGPPQDIWACGVLLFTLMYRENPFNSITGILESELKVPFVLSEDSFDLVSKMLNRDVEKRLNIDQVLTHPWFAL